MKPDWERIESIIANACETYTGSLDVLESAIGALLLGQYFGWRVLRIIHSSRTYSRYEKILGVKFSEVCPDHTKLSRRNNGYRWVESYGNFWRAINESRIPPKARRDVTPAK